MTPTEQIGQDIAAAKARLDAGGALSKSEIALLVGVSVKSLDRWVKSGSFPGPDLIMNQRCIRWSAKVVRAELPALTGGQAK